MKAISFIRISIAGCLLMMSSTFCEAKERPAKDLYLEIIYKYIYQKNIYSSRGFEHKFYVIDTDFRAFKSTPKKRAVDTRFSILKEVLTQKLSSKTVKELNIYRLAQPNNSQEVQTLKNRIQATSKNSKNNYCITFSLPVSNNGRTYYYVEEVSKINNASKGELFVLKAGIVESVIHVWIS